VSHLLSSMDQLDLTFVDEIVAKVGTGQEKVLELLQAIQGHYGYLPTEALQRVCELTEITPAVAAAVRASGVREGLCTVFIRHTSASLVIQENADPSVRRDLEAFLSRLAEADPELRRRTADLRRRPRRAGKPL